MIDSYTPKYPNWFYSFIDIPEISLIQRESHSLFQEFKIYNKVTFYSFKYQELESRLSILTSFVKRTGLYEKWFATVVGIVPPGKNYPAHVDSSETNKRFLSLNIPILNTVGTLNKWHALTNRRSYICENLDIEPIDPSAKSGFFVEEGEEVVLAQTEALKPMVMNVSMPHSVYNPTKNYRGILSLRFSPELTEQDLLNLGIKNPFVQTDPI